MPIIALLLKIFLVSEPDSILPNPNITAVLCYGENTGTAVLSPTGGITPYVEDWGTAIPSDLYAGTYTYSITDSNSCVYFGEVIIIEPDPILPNPIIADVLCNGDSTGITVLSPTEELLHIVLIGVLIIQTL